MNNIDSNNAEELLKQKGVRPTANRILILKTLQNEHRPMSLSTMEAILLPMDKSSIFRVLTLFLEHDIVHASRTAKVRSTMSCALITTRTTIRQVTPISIAKSAHAPSA